VSHSPRGKGHLRSKSDPCNKPGFRKTPETLKSSAIAQRREFSRLMDRLEPGDVLLVTKLSLVAKMRFRVYLLGVLSLMKFYGAVTLFEVSTCEGVMTGFQTSR
jgi:hypothetical protein